MLNYIWASMMLMSAVCALLTGRGELCLNSILSGTKDTVNTVLVLAGLMALWSGIMEAAKEAGLCGFIEKITYPLLKFLFPELKGKKEALSAIAMNITANVLGLGNSATPLGLEAMRRLDAENKGRKEASNSMCLFALLNSASLQIIPTTVISLRAAAGSKDPGWVILPIWITSLSSLLMAVISCKILQGAIPEKGEKRRE
ncbi:MAG: spore maturation protein [Bacillota bacterium]|nr:spore maturation protein [Bacillota bacterium]